MYLVLRRPGGEDVEVCVYGTVVRHNLEPIVLMYQPHLSLL